MAIKRYNAFVENFVEYINWRMSGFTPKSTDGGRDNLSAECSELHTNLGKTSVCENMLLCHDAHIQWAAMLGSYSVPDWNVSRKSYWLTHALIYRVHDDFLTNVVKKRVKKINAS